MLYSRQIIVMLLQLISVRLLLNVLGVEDYGIYNVVSGIVLLLSFLTGAMASATQRFFFFCIRKTGQRSSEQDVRDKSGGI